MSEQEFFAFDDEGPLAGEERRCFSIPDKAHGERLDAFLRSVTGLSRSRVKKTVEQGGCLVDGRPCLSPDARLRTGQTLEFALPGPSDVVTPEEGPLDIVYSDADIAVVNKPAGLTMHPCPSCPSGTLVHRLLARFPVLMQQEGPRPGIVHRLDKDTSGLVVIALSERARLRLAEAFAAREVHKTYLALTRGIPPQEGGSEQPIGRHPALKTRMAVVPVERGGREARTAWKTLYAAPSGRFALLAVQIFTGRTHQIRVHMANLGHPLWGDAVYGPRDAEDPAPRQMLHAWKLEFLHPVTGKALAFQCPPPEDMPRAMLALERETQRLILTGTPGCGKSAVLERFRARGVPVWSADAVVAELYRPKSDGWYLMHRRWGDAFFREDGSVDRARLTTLLAETPGMRRELERLIHPLVRASMERFFEQETKARRPVAAAEVPLWFETGWPRPEGANIVVITCPDAVRHARLCRTRGWNVEKIAAVESWQWSQEEKAAAAELTLSNAGSLEDLDRGVEALFCTLKERGKAREQERLTLWRGLWDRR